MTDIQQIVVQLVWVARLELVCDVSSDVVAARFEPAEELVDAFVVAFAYLKICLYVLQQNGEVGQV